MLPAEQHFKRRALLSASRIDVADVRIVFLHQQIVRMTNDARDLRHRFLTVFIICIRRLRSFRSSVPPWVHHRSIDGVARTVLPGMRQSACGSMPSRS